MNPLHIIGLISLITLTNSIIAMKESECPVCFGIVNKLKEQLKSKEGSITADQVTEEFLGLCKKAKKDTSDDKFCYYLGGQDVSATRTYKELAERVAWGFPPEKICDHLNKKDPQICEIREKKPIDLKTVDLKKLKVAELKRLLKERNEVCEGCFEKAEFIKKAEEIRAREEL